MSDPATITGFTKDGRMETCPYYYTGPLAYDPETDTVASQVGVCHNHRPRVDLDDRGILGGHTAIATSTRTIEDMMRDAVSVTGLMWETWPGRATGNKRSRFPRKPPSAKTQARYVPADARAEREWGLRVKPGWPERPDIKEAA